jgi:hypothetical protein
LYISLLYPNIYECISEKHNKHHIGTLAKPPVMMRVSDIDQAMQEKLIFLFNKNLNSMKKAEETYLIFVVILLESE